MGLTIIIKNKERLPYGSNSRGKFIPPEKGRRAIFVPSFGVLEKEEVDYLIEASQEKEDERLKKTPHTETMEQIEKVAQIALQAKSLDRAKAIKELLRR